MSATSTQAPLEGERGGGGGGVSITLVFAIYFLRFNTPQLQASSHSPIVPALNAVYLFAAHDGSKTQPIRLAHISRVITVTFMQASDVLTSFQQFSL